MTRLSRTQWALLVVIVLVAGGAWTAASRVPVSEAAQVSGRRSSASPDFTLPALDGSTFKLSGQRGKLVVVNFWATWCGPCRAEMPALEAFHRSHPDDVVIVGVDVSEQKDIVAQFVRDVGVTYPIALDTSGQVSELYRVSGLPTTYFIGPDGSVRDMVIGGPLTKAAIESKVADLK